MTRRTGVLAIGGSLAVACAVAAVIMFSGNGAITRPSRAGTSSTVKHVDQGHRVAAALARLATDPQSLVADEARHQVGSHARQAIPPGSVVTPHESSWAPDGVGGGTMLVTVSNPAGARVTYAAVMIHEHHDWRVLATVPVTRAR